MVFAFAGDSTMTNPFANCSSILLLNFSDTSTKFHSLSVCPSFSYLLQSTDDSAGSEGSDVVFSRQLTYFPAQLEFEKRSKHFGRAHAVLQFVDEFIDMEGLIRTQ